MTSTKIRVECASKKEAKNWNPDFPFSTTIELSIPYDQTSIYYQMTGVTGPIFLNTINQNAADMFTIGNFYDIVISPSAE